MTDHRQYKKISSIKSTQEFKNYLEELEINIPVDHEIIPGDQNPLAQSVQLKDGRVVGNRFCVHPMEGWDGTLDGRPSELTIRRWKHFGQSGAKLIWGGEATAVVPTGRANPNQLMMLDDTMAEIEKLRKILVEEHIKNFHNSSDLYIGLQLTHSGRFCKPYQKDRFEPKIAYHHPLLDELFHTPSNLDVVSDNELDDIIDAFVRAAVRAEKTGFDFVDIKHCHGYLSHELLSAVERPGIYGGSFENRTRFLREVVNGIRRDCSNIAIGVRLSMFDFPPFRPDEEGFGRMLRIKNMGDKYPYAFGGDPNHAGTIKLNEVILFLKLLESLDIHLVNLSAGSPYYNPHITRPAYYPPSDGYKPPEDPLIGVARHINTGAVLNHSVKDILLVGSGYSYLQEFLPNVAQAVVANGEISFVGLGRMILSYPQMPSDILAGKPLSRQHICRTFSDCTTAPRIGLVSGCYPLDQYYKDRPEYIKLKEFNK